MTTTLILTEKEGWHFKQLEQSLKKYNHKVLSSCLSKMCIKIVNNKQMIYIKDKPCDDINNIIVRFIPGGSLEEIVFYLNILKLFEQQGVNVINQASKIEDTVDKLYTSILLSENNIKTPNTYVFRSKTNAHSFLKKNMLNKQFIYKPLFGSQGDNIAIVSQPNDLDVINNPSNVYYFQDYLHNEINHDYRVLVFRKADKFKYYYMTRYGNSFINNISKGASCLQEIINPKIIDLALKSSMLLGIDFCGVDIIQYNNEYYVIEVNSIPAWRGLQNVENENISQSFVDFIIEGKGLRGVNIL